MTGICPQSSDLYIKSKLTNTDKCNGLTETAYKINHASIWRSRNHTEQKNK